MPTSLNRRELLTLAVAVGATAAAIPALAQIEPATSAQPAAAPAASEPDTTLEGVALVSAAYAAAGYTLPADQVAEVRKQLAGYPGDFAKARKLALDNGVAPTMDVSPAPRSPEGKAAKEKVLGVTL